MTSGAAAHARDVARAPAGAPLRDAGEVTIRPIRASDKALELAFLNRLSKESLYQRLMTHRKLLPGELERLTGIDPEREIALIATVARDGGEEQIGVARLAREGTGSNCEFAIVIADAWQGRGVGTRLLGELIEQARRAGYRGMWGLGFASNKGVIALGRRLGFAIRAEPGDATLRRLVRAL